MGEKKRRVKESLKLTDDLIIDILSRVSHKDFLRFTCVSKSWRSLINTDLYLSHLRSQRTDLIDRPFLLIEIGKTPESGTRLYHHHRLDLDSIEDENPNPREIHNPFDDDDDHCPRRDAFVAGSCEGLLVFQQCSSHKMIVSNPITKKHHVVPPNPAGDDNVVFFGFGYDHVHNCYKLVTKIEPAGDQGHAVELMVYNVNNGTWKRSRFDTLDDRVSYTNLWDKYVDGALYYCVRGGKIRCFVLAEEEFYELDPPCFGDDYSLTVFGGRLCWVCCNSPPNDRVEFWVMKCDCKRESTSMSCSWHWTKFLSISDVKAVLLPQFRLIDLVPICASVCGNKILFNVDYLQLFWYDLEKNKFYELKNCIGRCNYILVTNFVPSLAGMGIS